MVKILFEDDLNFYWEISVNYSLHLSLLTDHMKQVS